MIGFLIATSHESESLLKRLTEVNAFTIETLRCVTGRLEQRKVVVAILGVGLEQAGAQTRWLTNYFRLKAIILAGYGGALTPQLKKSQVVIANNYTTDDVQHFLRFIPGFDFATFCSAQEVIASVTQKHEFARISQAQVVDMETAAVAQVADEKQIPFIAVRAISDELEEVWPYDLLSTGYDVERQCVTPIRFLLALARQPWRLGAVVRFLQQLGLVRKKLTEFLFSLNQELPKNW
jgi:adenosylhomocysteine nucleosidase